MPHAILGGTALRDPRILVLRQACAQAALFAPVALLVPYHVLREPTRDPVVSTNALPAQLDIIAI